MIGKRLKMLTGWVLDAFVAMKHANGRALLQIYGPTTTQDRGGVVTCNFYDQEGELVPDAEVEAKANARNLSLRTVRRPRLTPAL